MFLSIEADRVNFDPFDEWQRDELARVPSAPQSAQ